MCVEETKELCVVLQKSGVLVSGFWGGVCFVVESVVAFYTCLKIDQLGIKNRR